MNGSASLPPKKNWLSSINHDQRVKGLCRRAFDCAVAHVGISLLLIIKKLYEKRLTAETGVSFFYYQERIGLNGEPFVIVKLQTMNQETDQDGNLLPDTQRLGPLGAWMRKYKIDEFPQFINVLRDEMSVVGPRPHRSDEKIAQIPKRQKLLPGITGLGKIVAGNDQTHAKELIADYLYQRKCRTLGLTGFMLYNAKLIAFTPIAIIRQRHTPTSYSAAGLSRKISYVHKLK